jgi:Ase1/PRC1/MAP65 family protein
VVHNLCIVLGMDFFSTITEVHPSLDDSVDVSCKRISDDTLSKLDKTVVSLKEDKQTRLHKVYVLLQENIFLDVTSSIARFCLVMLINYFLAVQHPLLISR